VNVNGNPDQVVTNWEALKRAEKADKGEGDADSSLLDSIPKGLPALLQSHQYQARAARVNFDWPQVEEVMTKLREEMDEVLEAETPEHRAEEVGDVLFVMVNVARWLGVEPEMALRDANRKFYQRFHYMEQQVKANGKEMSDHTLAELDKLWDEAKAQGL
jgi:tetrapyrrole methylase family protein/MazG family protein